MRPVVSIVPCPDYDPARVRAALTRAVEEAGGLDWVRPGMTVAVKLNLIGAHEPEKAATPHPAVVTALGQLLADRGARVVLGDSPGGPYNRAFLENVYRRCGMVEAARACGAELNEDFSTVAVELPEGVSVKTFTATKYLLECDAVVDLCKLKTHALTAYTGACKNMFGGVAGMEKVQFHYQYPTHRQFGDAMVDICEYFRPRLSVCDAVVGMEGNGPSSGSPRQVGLLLASENPHALDLCAARVIGLGPGEVPTLEAAIGRGLCPEALTDVEVRGGAPADFRVADYRLQPKSDITQFPVRSKLLAFFARGLLKSRPVPDETCIGCGKCREYCPAEAITIRDGRAVIDRGKCIRCFCCGEFCPVGSVKPHLSPVAKLLSPKHA